MSAGTVPETRTADADPTRSSDASPANGDRPEADGPSAEEIVRDAQRTVREGEGVVDPAALDEAIRASEAADGARVTEARIRDGSLLAADGTAPLDALGADARATAAADYVDDLRERAAGAGEPLGDTADRLASQTDLVRSHLGEFYADPDAALGRLEGLDDAGRQSLADGDSSVLGPLRPDADPGGLHADALVAHRDVVSQFPDEAALVGDAREQARAEALLTEIGPEARGTPDPGRLSRGGPGDPAGDLEPPTGRDVQMPGLEESMEHRVIAHAMSPHQI